MTMQKPISFKRPHEVLEIKSGKSTHHKRPRLDRDHVQNTLAQSSHEASTTLRSPSFGNADVPQSTSNPPKYVAESQVYIPKLQRGPIRPPRPSEQKSMDMPPLPLIADRDLEAAAFTHPTCLQGHNQRKLDKSYDRLEFLGDAYVELIASRLVYTQYAHMPAGRLSQQRERLVKNESLAELSIAYGFEKRASLPPKVSHVVPPIPKRPLDDLEKQWVKMLGDIFEAFVAAVVLSNPSKGYQTVEHWLHQLWIPRLQNQDSAEVRKPPAADSKQQLAKRVLGKGIKLEYRDAVPPDLSEKASGKTWYTIGAFLTGWGWSQVQLGEGKALNKSQAGMIAATQALSNPVTEQIEKVKKESYLKDLGGEAAEKKAANEATNAQQNQGQRGRIPDFQTGGTLKWSGEDGDEDSLSDDTDDSDSSCVS